MSALGWALIHFLWQGAAIAAVLAVALAAMRNAGAQARYLASCVALLVMAACVPATAVWISDSGLATLPEGVRGLVLEDVRAGGRDPGGLGWQEWVVVGWAIGAAILLLRAAMSWVVARRGSRRGVKWDYPIGGLMARLGVAVRIEMLVSRYVDAPQVFGWLKPVVLIPFAAVANLTPREMEAVLAHELAHIARRDYLVNLVQTVIESLLFYHPAVWWVSRRVRLEREHCCDDIAVEICGDRTEYSRALLKLEETRPAFAMAATAGGLKMRIMRLMGMRENGPSWGPGVVIAGAVLLTGGLLWAAQPPVPPPPEAPEPPVPVVAAATAKGPVAPAAPTAPKLAAAAVPSEGTSPALAPAAPAAPVVESRDEQAPPPPPPPPAGQAVKATAPPPPPPPPAPANIPEERVSEAESRVAMQEAKLKMEMDRDPIKEMKDDVKRELEKAMAELQANKAQMEHDIQKALQDMKGQASSVEAQKEAQAAMVKAMKELQAREPEIRKNIEQAMKNLEGEMKDIESTFQKERAERERRIGYADQKWSKGDVKGSTTAKGRHYTRYGPPDEIETHPGKGENWLYRNWRGTGGKMIFEFDADGQLKR